MVKVTNVALGAAGRHDWMWGRGGGGNVGVERGRRDRDQRGGENDRSGAETRIERGNERRGGGDQRGVRNRKPSQPDAGRGGGGNVRRGTRPSRCGSSVGGDHSASQPEAGEVTLAEVVSGSVEGSVAAKHPIGKAAKNCDGDNQDDVPAVGRLR